MKPVIIYGAGGHGRVIADIFNSASIPVAGFVDNGKKSGDIICDIPVYQQIEELPSNLDSYQLFIAIGSNEIRKKLYETYKDASFATAIHPTAIISPYVQIAPGTCVMPGAIINNNAQIGMQCIINSGAIIEHDCVIGDFSHISPGAVLSGSVCIGSCCHLGSGSSVRNGIKIKDNITVGCGNAVVADLTEPGIYVGVPAKKLIL